MTATQTPKVYEAIRNVMHDVGVMGISKDRKNAQQGYSFRGIDDIYNALNGILSKNNLVILPRAISRNQEERQSKSGGAMFYTSIEMEFKIVCSLDGSSDLITTFGEAMDSADKSSNKAQAAAYKYAAMMLFCIPTEGDNDADSATPIVTANANNATNFAKVASDLTDVMNLCTSESELAILKASDRFTSEMNSLPEDLYKEFAAAYKAKKTSLAPKVAS